MEKMKKFRRVERVQIMVLQWSGRHPVGIGVDSIQKFCRHSVRIDVDPV